MPLIKAGLVFFLLLAAVPLIAPNVEAGHPEEFPEGLVAAARSGLPRFLEAIGQDELGHFTFSSLDDLQNAELGEPFQVHTIHPRDILDYDGSATAISLTRSMDIWLFPVLVDSQARTLLTVERNGDEWKAVALGSSQLARQWEAIARSYPLDKGYERTFVRVYQARSDLILLHRPVEAEVFVALPSATQGLGLTAEKIHQPAEVLMRMRETVRKSLQLDPTLQ